MIAGSGERYAHSGEPGPAARSPSRRVDRGPAAEPRHIVAEARILEAVLDGGPMTGTPAELAYRLGMPVQGMFEALGALTAAGWLSLRTAPDGRLRIDWDEHDAEPAPGQ